MPNLKDHIIRTNHNRENNLSKILQQQAYILFNRRFHVDSLKKKISCYANLYIDNIVFVYLDPLNQIV